MGVRGALMQDCKEFQRIQCIHFPKCYIDFCSSVIVQVYFQFKNCVYWYDKLL